RRKRARPHMQRNSLNKNTPRGKRGNEPWREMEACGWRRDRAWLLREQRLIILRVPFVGAPPAGNIRRQRHLAYSFDCLVERLGGHNELQQNVSFVAF